MTRQEQKGAALRELHAGEPFVIPNPWDVGSARVLEALGFQEFVRSAQFREPRLEFDLDLVDGARDPFPWRHVVRRWEYRVTRHLALDLRRGVSRV